MVIKHYPPIPIKQGRVGIQQFLAHPLFLKMHFILISLSLSYVSGIFFLSSTTWPKKL